MYRDRSRGYTFGKSYGINGLVFTKMDRLEVTYEKAERGSELEWKFYISEVATASNIRRGGRDEGRSELRSYED